jgi:hypothetical protein
MPTTLVAQLKRYMVYLAKKYPGLAYGHRMTGGNCGTLAVLFAMLSGGRPVYGYAVRGDRLDPPEELTGEERRDWISWHRWEHAWVELPTGEMFDPTVWIRGLAFSTYSYVEYPSVERKLIRRSLRDIAKLADEIRAAVDVAPLTHDWQTLDWKKDKYRHWLRSKESRLPPRDSQDFLTWRRIHKFS